MRSRTMLAAALTALASLVGSLGVAPSSVAQAPTDSHVVDACGPARAGFATCFAQYVAVSGGRTPLAVRPNAAGPDGAGRAAGRAAPLTPAQIQDAYDVDPTRGAGRTIAIVDAYDNPRAERDLATFRKTYGLPACTTANGCFRKVNQRGQAAPLPEGDQGWGLEIALDLQAASAVCPRCRLLLVEGRDSSLRSLGTAENTAVSLGATTVSNSYGTDGELAGMDKLGSRYYTHRGVPILASTGDFGFGAASFPAVLQKTVAVGGTRIVPGGGARGWSESVWDGAGSGCSAYIAKPSWQPGASCGYRTVGDVSAMADPATGLVVYDTYGESGWVQVGGTSLSAPLVAAMIAMSPQPRLYDGASRFYFRDDLVDDVVGGSNGFCGRDYLCTGLPGYDAPSGVGSPVASRL